MLKDERKETDEMRALVDSWLHAVKKLNLLSEELVSTNSVLFSSFNSFIANTRSVLLACR